MIEKVGGPITAGESLLTGVKFNLPLAVEVSARTAVVEQDTTGSPQFTSAELVFQMQPGQYFNVRIPLPTLSQFKNSNGGALQVSSIVTQLQIQRIKPALIGHLGCAYWGPPQLPFVQFVESWVGGDNGPKDFKQLSFTWSPAVNYAGGGEIGIFFLQGAYALNGEVTIDEFLPATIHLHGTTIIFA